MNQKEVQKQGGSPHSHSKLHMTSAITATLGLKPVKPGYEQRPEVSIRVKLPQHLTCFNIHEHSFEGRDVAALNSLQHLYHVPHLSCSQLIINALQVITPTATKTHYKPTLGKHQLSAHTIHFCWA